MNPVILHQFAPAWGLNISPFCLKVETYLRLTDIPFTTKNTIPFTAPKGKLPFITHQGRTIADSGFIVDYLKQTFGDPLDSHLTAQQRAVGHMLRRMVEESLAFIMLYERWMTPAGWDILKPAFFPGLPPLVRNALPAFVRRSIGKSLHGQGAGRHSPDELAALGRRDLDAIACLLDQTPFAMGDKPTSFDATLFGFLLNLTDTPFQGPSHLYARQNPVLTAYVARMKAALPA